MYWFRQLHEGAYASLASTGTSSRRNSILQRFQDHLKAVSGFVFEGYEPKRLQTS